MSLKLAGAGRQMMKHLIEDRRCDQIYLVMNPGHNVIFREMLEEYRCELKAHRIPFHPEYILESLVSVQEGRALLDRIIGPEPDAGLRAVICAHDGCAIGICLEAEER